MLLYFLWHDSHPIFSRLSVTLYLSVTRGSNPVVRQTCFWALLLHFCYVLTFAQEDSQHACARCSDLTDSYRLGTLLWTFSLRCNLDRELFINISELQMERKKNLCKCLRVYAWTLLS